MSAGKIILIIISGIIFCLIAAGGTAGYYVYSNLQPVEADGESVMVTIAPGSSSKKIGNILENNGLIRDDQIFAYYVRFQGIGQQLKAGNYRLKKGLTLDQILSKLVEGQTYIPTFQVTIPEGYTVEQIADLLADQNRVNKDEFMKEIQQGEFDFDFVQKVPKLQTIRYRLEGYLFPETYEFKVGESEHDIIGRMLEQFDEEFKSEWKEILKKKNFTVHEAVTMASLVERETAIDFERPIVAGVLYNRLERDMLIQVDATVRYALKKQEKPLSVKDLDVDSLYNTYEYRGLPPGPISNPGRRSLESVIDPQDNQYLFYVTKKDGTREHYFSKTYSEHIDKKALSEQN